MSSNMEPATWQSAILTLWNQYPAIGALILLMGLDICTGLLAGFIKRELSSSTSLKGMCTKAMILAIVATGKVIEFVIPGVPWSQFLAICFCITESISITENAGQAGVPIPQAWMDALQKLKQKKYDDAHPISHVEIHGSVKEVHVDDDSVIKIDSKHKPVIKGTAEEIKRAQDRVMEREEKYKRSQPNDKNSDEAS